MKLDLSKISLSNNDKKLGLKFPKKFNKELAYFMGIHLGDGTMNQYSKYYYSVGYSGHLIDEYDFYKEYINNLLFKFFNKRFNFYQKKSKTGKYIELCTQSKGIFTFLNNALGIQPGPKINNKIPEIIKISKFKIDFIRGLADADFCLTFKAGRTYHKYPRITWDPKNKILLKQINEELINFGFRTSVLLDFPKKRYNKYYISNQLEISGSDQLELWMKTIGFNSRKHITKYLIWKKYGFCPPYTTLPQREAILNGQLDPYSFYKSVPKSL